MITIESARLVAEEFLDSNVRKRFVFEVVIIEELIKNLGQYWLFPYNGRGYADAGDWREAMAGNVPILVDKKTGKASFLRD